MTEPQRANRPPTWPFTLLIGLAFGGLLILAIGAGTGSQSVAGTGLLIMLLASIWAGVIDGGALFEYLENREQR